METAGEEKRRQVIASNTNIEQFATNVEKDAPGLFPRSFFMWESVRSAAGFVGCPAAVGGSLDAGRRSASRLKCGNFVRDRESQRDIIQAVEQAMTAKIVNFEEDR